MKYWNHISAKKAKEIIGDKNWNAYTKISILRNPFDYAISSYFWGVRTPEEREETCFESWLLSHPKIF
ncbi:MAG: hypothetical protein U5P41_09010 [Gammaproteobacteria bacterium]|nr:hypothetical protein [Gammaproteobacteria bacterium]